MSEKCLIDLKRLFNQYDEFKAMSGATLDSFVENLFHVLNRHMTISKKSSGGINFGQVSKEVAKVLEDQIKAAKAIRVRNALLDAQIEAQHLRNIEDHPYPELYLQQLMVGSVKGHNLKGEGTINFGQKRSIDAEQFWSVTNAIATLTKALDDNNLNGIAFVKNNAEPVMREAFNILNNKPIQNKKMGQVAQVFIDHYTKFINEANNAGSMKALDFDNMFEVNHNRNEIFKNKTRWKEFAKENFDLEKTFSVVAKTDEELDAQLNLLWDALVNGRNIQYSGAVYKAGNKNFMLRGGGLRAGFTGKGDLARRLSQESQVYFKDVESRIKYDKEGFGTKDFWESHIYNLEHLVRNTTLMKRLGTNPRAMLKKLVSSVQEDLYKRQGTAKGKELDAINKQIKSLGDMNQDTGLPRVISNWLKELDNSVNVGSNVSLATQSRFLRSLHTMGKLGSATLAAIPDIGIAAHAQINQGISGGAAYVNQIRSVFENLGGLSKKDKELAGRLGFMLDTFRGAAFTRFGAADNIPGQMTKMMHLFFKLNLMNWWNDSHRSAAGFAMAQNLADSAKVKFDKLDDGLRNTLKQYDIGEAEWNVYRTLGVEQTDRGKMITTDFLDNVKPSVLKQYMDDLKAAGRLSDTDIRVISGEVFKVGGELEYSKAKDLLRSKLGIFYSDSVNNSVLMPGAWERGLMNQGTASGTWMGEIARHFFLFKSFPITVIRKALRGATFSAKTGGKASIHLPLALAVSQTGLGMLAMMLKDIAKGREPRLPDFDNLTSSKNLAFATSAISQGGGLGIYGDLLFGNYSRYHNQFLPFLLGPTGGLVEDLSGMWSIIKGDNDEKLRRFTNALVRQTRTLIPGNNIFYIRAPLDYAFFNYLNEITNPGYLRRVERGIMRDYGTKYYFPPSTHSAGVN